MKSQPKQPVAEPTVPVKAFRSKRWLLIIGAIAAVVAAGLALLTTGFSLAQVQLAGMDTGYAARDAGLRTRLEQAMTGYRVSFAYPSGEQKAFAPSSAGVKVDAEATMEAVAQAKGRWPWQRVTFWRRVNVPLVLKVDPNVLHTFVKRKATVGTTRPVNAAISVVSGKVRIKAEVPGRGHQVAGGDQAVVRAIELMQITPLRLEATVLKPAIVTSDLRSVRTRVNKILAQPISFKIDKRQITTSPTDIGTWLDFTAVEADSTVDVTVNGGKILEYINRIAKPYIRLPRTQVVMKMEDGTTKVLVRGQSGSDVRGKNEVVKSLIAQVGEATGIQATLPVSFASHKTISAQAYTKWILVDLTNKRLYAYEKTTLRKTILVSAGAPETPTAQGEFNVYHRLRRQDMQGPNADGSRYYAPNVEWVQYFYQDMALHGNYWRPAHYFGNINSSHGCVGMLNNDAQWVFNWAAVGTPVIVTS